MAPASHSDLYPDQAPEQPQQPLPPGQRLLCDVIDHYAATDPARVWASTPRSADLAQGFVDITYAEWANAINHAANWLEATFGPASSSPSKSTTIVYRGPYDVRYPTLYVAGTKTSIRMLCLSYFVSVENQLNLLNVLDCNAIVHPGDDPFVEQLQARRPSLKSYIAPTVVDWFNSTPAPPYPRQRSYADVAEEPAIVFHTSGTTGAEKPFPYKNRMLAGIDIHGANPRLPPSSTPKLMERRRWYTSFPLHTVIGMQPVVPMAVFWGAIPIINPHVRHPMPSAADVHAVLRYGNVDGLQAAPKQLDELCRMDGAAALLARLRVVQYAGSKLIRATGDALAAHGIHLQAMIGSTEAGGYPTLSHKEPDWQYLKFAPVPGLEFRPWAPSGASIDEKLVAVNVLGTTGDISLLRPPPPRDAGANGATGAKQAQTTAPNGPPPERPKPATPGLYELTFVHNPKLPHGQQIFAVKPELKSQGFFRTGDIFSPHPRIPGMWLLEGRTVDFLAFGSSDSTARSIESASHADILNVSTYEDALISACKGRVSGVVAGGEGHASPYVLIEMSEATDRALERQNVLVAVGEVNERLGLRENARVRGDRVFFAEAGKEFIWNSKDVVNRDGTSKVFSGDLGGS